MVGPPAPGTPTPLILSKRTKACQLHAAGLRVGGRWAKPPLRGSLQRAGAQHRQWQRHLPGQQVSCRQRQPSHSQSPQQPAARVANGLPLLLTARRIRTLRASLGLPTSARRQVTCIWLLCLGAVQLRL